MLIFRSLFLPFIDYIMPGDGHSPGAIADHMAAFHTVFNIANTIIFIPFVKVLANLAEKMVPAGDEPGEEEFHLKYITTTLLSTPSMNINQARLEIKRMMEMANRMFDLVMEVFKNPEEKLGEVVEEILTLENHIDLLEKEISSFVVRVSQYSITIEQSQEISVMLQRINELESIGDQCESLLRLIRRKYDEKLEFSESANEQILEISGKVKEFLILISENITSVSSRNIITRANVIENRINELRIEMRKNHIKRLSEGICDVPTGLVFIDMLTSFEKIGDYAYNISEGISGLRIF